MDTYTWIFIGTSIVVFTIAFRWTSQPDGPPTMALCVECMKPIKCYDTIFREYECIDGHDNKRCIRIESKDYLDSKMKELKEENEKLKGQTE